tara:strand:+ start:12928 stop:13041 length:114 start_codon:yes stop_codon:yes gene_type:complete
MLMVGYILKLFLLIQDMAFFNIIQYLFCPQLKQEVPF